MRGKTTKSQDKKSERVGQFSFNEKKLAEEIRKNAMIAGIPEGTAQTIAEKVAMKTAAWAGTRAVITVDDLYRRVAQEAEKYSADLAYIYQNRGKII